MSTRAGKRREQRFLCLRFDAPKPTSGRLCQANNGDRYFLCPVRRVKTTAGDRAFFLSSECPKQKKHLFESFIHQTEAAHREKRAIWAAIERSQAIDWPIDVP